MMSDCILTLFVTFVYSFVVFVFDVIIFSALYKALPPPSMPSNAPEGIVNKLIAKEIRKTNADKVKQDISLYCPQSVSFS